MRLIEVNSENIDLLELFISNLGRSANSFKYYKKRSTKVIQNHIATFLIAENDNPICYGHLDKDGDIVWLGIAVVEAYVGKGLGKKMMNLLIEKGIKLGVESIRLSVDTDNDAAIHIYEKFGFQRIEKQPNYFIYQLGLK